MKQIELETSNAEMALKIACEGFKCYTRVWSKKYSTEYYLEFSSDELTRILATALKQKFDEAVDEVFKNATIKN